jgi:hypothetical protein
MFIEEHTQKSRLRQAKSCDRGGTVTKNFMLTCAEPKEKKQTKRTRSMWTRCMCSLNTRRGPPESSIFDLFRLLKNIQVKADLFYSLN